MTVSAALLVAVIAAVVGPLIAYLTASRKLSGKIGTSEASQLWDESRAIRNEYRERIDQASIRTAALEERLAKLEQRNNELTRENIDLKSKASDSERRVKDLQARLDVIEIENAHLKQRIEELTLGLQEGKEKKT